MSTKQNPVHISLFGCTGKVFRANHCTQLAKQTRRVLGFGYTVNLYSIFPSLRYVQRAQLVEGLLGVMFG
jgi:hypothetical protein